MSKVHTEQQVEFTPNKGQWVDAHQTRANYSKVHTKNKGQRVEFTPNKGQLVEFTPNKGQLVEFTPNKVKKFSKSESRVCTDLG